MNSIVEYYNTYDYPITDTQKLALSNLMMMIQVDMPFPDTFGEARDLIVELHAIYKANL